MLPRSETEIGPRNGKREGGLIGLLWNKRDDTSFNLLGSEDGNEMPSSPTLRPLPSSDLIAFLPASDEGFFLHFFFDVMLRHTPATYLRQRGWELRIFLYHKKDVGGRAIAQNNAMMSEERVNILCVAERGVR
jgi:hypothetical protein